MPNRVKVSTVRFLAMNTPLKDIVKKHFLMKRVPAHVSDPPVASFDLFDTLFVRCCAEPADLFIAIGEVLVQRNLISADAEAWAAHRRRAERAVRQQTECEEVTLAEIYHHLAVLCGWTARQASEAMDVERDFERRSARPVAPAIREMNRQRNLNNEVVFVSDIYLPRDDIHAMLKACGIRADDDRLFISADIGLTKQTGTLFEHVMRALEVPPSSILHTGDNPVPDIRSATTLGIRAYHARDTELTRYEAVLRQPLSGSTLLHSAMAGSARVARLSLHQADAHQNAIWTVGSGVAGPVLFGYVAWLLQAAQRRGLKRLYFLARDGQILLALAKRIAGWLGIEVECRYLYASRQALFLPAYSPGSTVFSSWFLDGIASLNIHEAFARLGLDPAEFTDALSGMGFPQSRWSEPLGAVGAELAPSVLDHEAVRVRLAEVAGHRRGMLQRYLIQEGWADGKPFGIVDLGWKGRLQQGLGLVANHSDGINAERLVGLYFGLTRTPPPDPRFGRWEAYLPESNKLTAVLLEVFTAADHGSTIGYAEGPDGRVVPVIDGEQDEVALAWGLRTQQEAILVYADAFMAFTWPSKPSLGALVEAHRSVTIPLLRVLFDAPGKPEAEAYGRFLHADGQAHDTFQEVAPRLSRLTILRALLGLRRAGYEHGFWLPGSIARSRSGVADRVVFGAIVASRRSARRLYTGMRMTSPS